MKGEKTMEVRGISFGDEIGGVAFLGSLGVVHVELCFDDPKMQKNQCDKLYVFVTQYQEYEEIRVADRPIFGFYVDSDLEIDTKAVDEATLESYSDEFGGQYHDKVKAWISKSVFANEIALARHVMDLFQQGKYAEIGSFYGKEADEILIPEVKYDQE